MTNKKWENQALHRRLEPRTKWISVARGEIKPAIAYLRTFGNFADRLEDLDTPARAHDKTMWFYILDNETPFIQEDHWDDICDAVLAQAGGLNKLREGYPALYEIVQPKERRVINGKRVRELLEARFDRDMRDDG